MAHEINNPIGFIRSNLNAAMDYLGRIQHVLTTFHQGDFARGEAAWNKYDIDFLLQDFPGLLAESISGADRVARIVSNLKSYAAIDCSSTAPLDLNESLQNVIDSLHAQLPGGVTLELDLRPLPTLICDQSRINQMLFALIQNARLAVLDGGRIRVSTACGGDDVVITIGDDGVGIAPDILQRVFDPFFTTRDVAQGHGTGPDRQPRHRHRARRQHCDREQNRPRHLYHGAPAVAARAGSCAMSYAHLFTGEVPASDNTAPHMEPYRILLVDDEPNVLSALRRVFRQENYELVTCEDPQQALTLLDGDAFHLIISDYMMPGMNGGELLKQARALCPDTIRIMMTGHADVNAVIGAMKSGAVYKFILKPWDDDDLRVTVALALEQHALIQKNNSLKRDNQVKAREIEQLAKFGVSNRSQLAVMLHKRGLLSNTQVQELMRVQQQRKEPMIKLIVERSWLSEEGDARCDRQRVDDPASHAGRIQRRSCHCGTGPHHPVSAPADRAAQSRGPTSDPGDGRSARRRTVGRSALCDGTGNSTGAGIDGADSGQGGRGVSLQRQRHRRSGGQLRFARPLRRH